MIKGVFTRAGDGLNKAHIDLDAMKRTLALTKQAAKKWAENAFSSK